MRLAENISMRPCKNIAASLFFLSMLIAPLTGAPVVNGVVNGASFAQGAIGPGTIIAIFGTGLARSTVSASTLPLPTALDGTSVTINGQPIPLFFVSPGQINAQLPVQLANGSVQLTVRDANGATGSKSITIASSSPAIFTVSADGKGDAIAVHANFKLVRKAVLEYATIGETIILFCTGLGAVDNFNTAGAASPSSPLATTSVKPTILMNGRPAQVTFSGLAPGFAGLYQINFVIPEGLGGDVPTTISMGGATSNQVNINVHGNYFIASNYSGQVQYRSTGNTYQLNVSSFTVVSTTRATGRYSLSLSGSQIDAGSFTIDVSTTLPTLVGQSSVVGGTFVGVLDTLDAGQSFFGILYNASTLAAVQDPDSWYAAFVMSVAAPARPAPPPPVLPGVSSSCAAIEGALIFADDGTFLGRVTSNSFAADSIGNPYGPYGSQFSSTSIFNPFGAYGSQFSSTSAFNNFAANPPIIFLNRVAVAFLTTNQFKTPSIDPRALFPCIGRS